MSQREYLLIIYYYFLPFGFSGNSLKNKFSNCPLGRLFSLVFQTLCGLVWMCLMQSQKDKWPFG